MPVVKRTMAAALLSLACTAASGQDPKTPASDYPNKTITIVVTVQAGSQSDLFARLVAERLQSRLGKPVVDFSPALRAYDTQLKGFLHQRMYRHDRVRQTREGAHAVVKELFQLFLSEPDRLPGEWTEATRGLDETGRARVVADYIAGMTDRFAFVEHKRLFGLDADPL